MGRDGARWVMGMMSGTALDGVDAALLETDGEKILTQGPRLFRPYKERERMVLRKALLLAPRLPDRHTRKGMIKSAERIVTRVHGEVARALLATAQEQGITPSLIGFHGQTIFHAPARRLTVQVGDGAALAQATGLPVVYDFRAADVAAGGQGAPLVPLYHRALAEWAGLSPPFAFLNIGGVANITLAGKDGALLAFDTGPGNAILDDLIFAETGEAFDAGGARAARGKSDEALIAGLLQQRYFQERPPKSLDRNAFTARDFSSAGATVEDRLATAAAFIAETVRSGLTFAPEPISRLIVCGGGAKNGFLLTLLAKHTGVEVLAADALGLDADFIEAQAFAYLALRSLRQLPISFPGTTGVAEPMRGGVFVSPAPVRARLGRR